tara:strand:- start:136 stop:294 length:159 start_codon:yes stop_codon:yes gene_type:complete
MKVGDSVKSGTKEGKIIAFQPKTRDIIVKDDSGIVHIFLASRTSLLREDEEQ